MALDPQEPAVINSGGAFRLAATLPSYSPTNLPSIGLPAFVPEPGMCVAVPREFDGELCSCGEDLEGASSRTCCVSWFCPCVTFGRNKYRLSGKTWRSVFWAVLFGALISLPILALLSTYRESCEPLEEKESCSGSVDLNRLKYRVGATFGVSFVIIVLMGTWNRLEMRRRLRIQGSGCGFRKAIQCEDLMAWMLCMCCALYQETRTLAHNNVEKGVWNGPGAMVIQAPLQATGIPVQAPHHIQPMEICHPG